MERHNVSLEGDFIMSGSWIKVSLLLSLTFLSANGQEEVSPNKRNQKLFFVSSSSTTSTLTTTTICYSTTAAATIAACGKRKRRTINDDIDAEPVDISPSSITDKADDEVLSGKDESVERDGRFLLYWMTTTSTSTSTTFTSTSTMATLECTPSGFTISACG